MKFFIGAIIIFSFVFSPYLEIGESMMQALMQPGKSLIIIGSALGNFIIENSRYIIFTTLKDLKYECKPPPDNKKSYEELLLFLFDMFKLIKSNGLLSIRRFLDSPQTSPIFNKYPTDKNKQAVIFCDYLRFHGLYRERSTGQHDARRNRSNYQRKRKYY
ncbi:MAG: hypothetical protein HRK26_01470 [Rickettsiaceae bacterium H1]|nr:hypothetical protein [Rickettsiaceae bacterium H1]